MNRLKISCIVTSVVVVIVALIFTLSLDNNFKSNGALAVFVTSKVLVTLLLGSGVVYALYSNAKTGSSAIVVGLGILYQFIPLGVRFLVKSNANNSLAFAWAIVLIGLLIYVVLLLGLSFQDKQMILGDKKATANEIAVDSEKRLATDDVKKD